LSSAHPRYLGCAAHSASYKKRTASGAQQAQLRKLLSDVAIPKKLATAYATHKKGKMFQG